MASETARSLGVTRDQQLTLDAHAGACSSACFYHLRRRSIRQNQRVRRQSVTAATGPCVYHVVSRLLQRTGCETGVLQAKNQMCRHRHL